MNINIRIIGMFLLPCALLLGCKSNKPVAVNPAPPEIVWPPPPAEAKIAFVKSFISPADIGIKKTGFARLLRVFTGARETDRFQKPFAVDVHGDVLVVTDTSSPAVWRFDLKNKNFKRWEKVGKLRFQMPVGIAMDGNTIYVADSELGLVVALDTAGKLINTIREGLERPTGVAVNAGLLYVCDSAQHNVHVFDSTGRAVRTFGTRGSGPGQLNFPTHISISGKGDELIITDSLNSRLVIFSLDGRPQGIISGAGNTSGHFSRPKGTATDSDGNIYAADALFDNLQIFDRQGRFLLDAGSSGPGKGEFWMPNEIAISSKNMIYVTDTYNKRVQILQYLGVP